MVIMDKQELKIHNLEKEIVALKKHIQILLSRITVIEDTQRRQKHQLSQLSSSSHLR